MRQQVLLLKFLPSLPGCVRVRARASSSVLTLEPTRKHPHVAIVRLRRWITAKHTGTLERHEHVKMHHVGDGAQAHLEGRRHARTHARTHTTSTLRGMVTEPPPKSGEEMVSSATATSVVSQRS